LILVAVVCLLTGYLLGRPSGPTREQWSLPEESIVQAAEAETKRIAEAQRLEDERRQQEAAEAQRKEDERRAAAAEAQAKRIAESQRQETERRQQAATESKRTEDERYQRSNNAPKPEPTGLMPRNYRALREYMLGR